jgi:hypothetical protein
MIQKQTQRKDWLVVVFFVSFLVVINRRVKGKETKCERVTNVLTRCLFPRNNLSGNNKKESTTSTLFLIKGERFFKKKFLDTWWCLSHDRNPKLATVSQKKRDNNKKKRKEFNFSIDSRGI